MNKIKDHDYFSPVLIFTFFMLMQITTWIPLRFWKIWSGSNYFDLNLVLIWSDCYGKYGNFIYEKPLDETNCTGYIYGSLLIKTLNFFNLTSHSTFFIGVTFMVVLALCIAAVLKKGDLFSLPLVLLIFSPPVILLAELGNVDTLILGLIILSALSLEKNRFLTSLILVAISSVLKFYTIPIFLFLFLAAKNRFQKSLTILVGTIVIFQVARDLKLIKSEFPSGYYEKFGLSIWPRYLENSHFSGFNNGINFAIGAALFVAFYFFLQKIMKMHKITIDMEPVGNKRQRFLFYFLFGNHLACFFAGMNFDHRLIFFILACIIYIKNFIVHGAQISRILISLFIMSIWLTFPGPGLEPVGDLALELATIVMTIKLVKLLKIDFNLKTCWKFESQGQNL